MAKSACDFKPIKLLWGQHLGHYTKTDFCQHQTSHPQILTLHLLNDWNKSYIVGAVTASKEAIVF